MTIDISIMLMVSSQIQKVRSRQQSWKQQALYFNKMTQRKLKIISRLNTVLSPCCMSSGESSTMVILTFSKKLALFLFKRHVCIFSFLQRHIRQRFILWCFPATKIRIWRAFMPASKIYVANCIGSVEVPTDCFAWRTK